MSEIGGAEVESVDIEQTAVPSMSAESETESRV